MFEIGAILFLLLGIISFWPPEPSEELLTSFTTKKNQRSSNSNRYHILIDYTKPVFMRRLWLIDSESGETICHSHVSHAWRSGVLYASNLSNQPQSFLSSAGLFEAQEKYYGKFGKSMRLVGIEEGINHKARTRAIVFHKNYFFWTYGCFGTWQTVNDKIVELANNNALIYVHCE